MAQTSNPKLFLAAIRQLPPLMWRVINNQAMIDNASGLGEQYQLTPKQQDLMMAIERNVIIQYLPVARIQEEIGKIGLPAEQAKNLTRDFLGRIVLPMEWHVGNVQTMIQNLGGRVDEYLADARQQFPEVYAPQFDQPVANQPLIEHSILQNFEDKIATPRGRADLLLRLTGLAGRIDELMKAETINQAEGEELMRHLDTLSFAVNTQDLNPLEVQSLKRRLRKVLSRLTANDHPVA